MLHSKKQKALNYIKKAIINDNNCLRKKLPYLAQRLEISVRTLNRYLKEFEENNIIVRSGNRKDYYITLATELTTETGNPVTVQPRYIKAYRDIDVVDNKINDKINDKKELLATNQRHISDRINDTLATTHIPQPRYDGVCSYALTMTITNINIKQDDDELYLCDFENVVKTSSSKKQEKEIEITHHTIKQAIANAGFELKQEALSFEIPRIISYLERNNFVSNGKSRLNLKVMQNLEFWINEFWLNKPCYQSSKKLEQRIETQEEIQAYKKQEQELLNMGINQHSQEFEELYNLNYASSQELRDSCWRDFVSKGFKRLSFDSYKQKVNEQVLKFSYSPAPAKYKRRRVA